MLRLSAKKRTIEAIDERTAALEATFKQIRAQPLDQLKALSSRGDVLASQANSATGSTLRGVRDQFDTLAWLFKQTADILIPLSKEGVLLAQYRHNLGNWRDAIKDQYQDALKALIARVGLLLALLAVVFVLTELWKRAVLRYVHEARRRYQLLLVRKIVLWALVVAIVGFTFATELGSLMTFAGLITAGLAVAMQSVLVSFVGYFFLIGKYGIRVGDRVQIGNVTGEVIDLGLVRLHLMELSGQGALGPPGGWWHSRIRSSSRPRAASSSRFRASTSPGTRRRSRCPAGADFSALKERLLQATVEVLEDYSEDIERQSKQIEKTTSTASGGDMQPQVQLHFSAASVEAIVRYPVQLQRAAEIDERVSRALMNVISGAGGETPRLT